MGNCEFIVWSFFICKSCGTLKSLNSFECRKCPAIDNAFGSIACCMVVSTCKFGHSIKPLNSIYLSIENVQLIEF